MSYALIDVVYLAACAVAGGALLRWRACGLWRPALVGGAGLLVLTAVFDNVMIAVGLFGYRPETLSGLAVGLAPIEDFAYPVAAAVLLPALWRRIRGPEDEKRSA